jgi:hypothetical protein
MAEVIGLVASIVALVELGFKISKGISAVANEFGSASVHIKVIATDTRAVALILRELQKRLERQRTVAVDVQDVAVEIVALCTTDIEDIGDFLKSLQPLQGQRIRLKQKLRWVIGKSKIMMKRSSLDSLKSTLNLYMHSIEFIENGEVEYVLLIWIKSMR